MPVAFPASPGISRHRAHRHKDEGAGELLQHWAALLLSSCCTPVLGGLTPGVPCGATSRFSWKPPLSQYKILYIAEEIKENSSAPQPNSFPIGGVGTSGLERHPMEAQTFPVLFPCKCPKDEALSICCTLHVRYSSMFTSWNRKSSPLLPLLMRNGCLTWRFHDICVCKYKLS